MSAPASRLPYNAASALAYAVKYCSKGNDCPDGEFYPPNLSLTWPFVSKSTDCTHFIGHIILAGGVLVPGTGASCKKGVIMRARELPTWFEMAATKYSNVHVLASESVTAAGDFAVLRRMSKPEGESKEALHVYHAVMLNSPCQGGKAKIFGHMTNRCGDEVVELESPVFYRIDSCSAFDGKWTSNDGQHRFRFEIAGEKELVWIERQTNGRELSRKVPMEPNGAEFIVRRANDDAVLQFLDFPNASLRAAIIAANPEPSTMALSIVNDKIVGVWRGLSVKKKADGSFNGLTQPSQQAEKTFNFEKQ